MDPRASAARPLAAFVLALLAGLGLLAGGTMMHLSGPGDGHGSMHGWMGRWSSDGVGAESGWPGLGTLPGLVVLAGAVGLYARPEARQRWGVLIVAASAAALVFGTGGFLAAILGLVAGALAVLPPAIGTG